MVRARRARSFYFFDDSLPDGYASWFGVRTLPKLNWGSAGLRERMQAVVEAAGSTPGLDGWRIDVANMTGRHRDADLHARGGGGDARRPRRRRTC